MIHPKPSGWASVFVPLRVKRPRGNIRRFFEKTLKWIGPTWRAAPIRRILQTACLGLYLYLFLYVAWPYTRIFTGDLLRSKEHVPAETFLWIDPLVGLSTAVTARAWNVALAGMAAILLTGMLFPRMFCGYICPLGTLIDFFDWLIFNRLRRWRAVQVGRWASTKYFILLAILTAAGFGVLISGFFAAIPVLTRGMHFSAGWAQIGWMKNWHTAGPMTAVMGISLILFAGVFLLSLLSPRFWCKYVCPTGAVFSVFNLFRQNERRVDSDCISCGKCIEVCPFDAIKEDFSTRTDDCTFCQTCGGACPTQSIHFGTRWIQAIQRKQDAQEQRALSRRSILASVIAGSACAIGISKVGASDRRPVRPPGSVNESDFLDLCIRCGECFKVCPGPVLHPAGLEFGFESLWTPVVVPTRAGCHPECNFCTQVCPTGAIKPLPLEQKKRVHMGLAKLNTTTCLPHRGVHYPGDLDKASLPCTWCYDECKAAGYHAIRMKPIELPVGERENTGMSEEEYEAARLIMAPFVNADACTGCGLCEYICHAKFVGKTNGLERSAIFIIPENEDRP